MHANRCLNLGGTCCGGQWASHASEKWPVSQCSQLCSWSPPGSEASLVVPKGSGCTEPGVACGVVRLLLHCWHLGTTMTLTKCRNQWVARGSLISAEGTVAGGNGKASLELCILYASPRITKEKSEIFQNYHLQRGCAVLCIAAALGCLCCCA